MNDSLKFKLIVIGCVILFVGAFVFLIVVLRDRLGRPLTDADFGDDGDDDEEPEDEETEETDESEEAEEVTGEDTETSEESPEEPAEPEGEVSSFTRPDPDTSESDEESLGDEGLESLFTELFEGKAPVEFESPDPESPAQPGSGVFVLDDILDSENYLGRTPEECGAPKESVSEERKEILTEGRLFGAFAYGGIKLGAEEEIGVPIACGYYAISHEISYDDCRKNLRARFGKTIFSGMQSYDEDDDEEGTVYCAFETPQGVLWLSHQNGRDFINLNFVP